MLPSPVWSEDGGEHGLLEWIVINSYLSAGRPEGCKIANGVRKKRRYRFTVAGCGFPEVKS